VSTSSSIRPKKIYLDYNATAPLRPEIREQMQEIWTQDNILNPSSVHWAGRKARQYFESARRSISQHFNRKASEIIFTSGGSEADNLALCGVEAERIIISQVEHPAVLETADFLEKNGREIIRISVDQQGQLNLGELQHALQPKSLVSIMAINNETGVIFPTEEITKMSHKAGALVHIDAVQSVGRLPLPQEADLITISGHKLGGPVGIGALISRETIPLAPMVHGGSQERGRRAGTGNVVGAMALAQALELTLDGHEEEVKRLQSLRDQLDEGLNQLEGVSILAQDSQRACNTSTVLFEGIEDESVLHALDLEGIACSSGSACASGSLEASHVLLAMGIPAKKARSALRISTGRTSTESHISYLIQSLEVILPQIRSL